MNLKESVDRLLESPDLFGAAFYEVFLDQHPEVQQFFEGINMHRQAVVLTMALVLIERYYSSPSPAVEQYLQYLGTRHHDRQIPEDLYPKWQDAMIRSLSDFHGGDWNPSLETQWREAIGRATELMFEGYGQRFTA